MTQNFFVLWKLFLLNVLKFEADNERKSIVYRTKRNNNKNCTYETSHSPSNNSIVAIWRFSFQCFSWWFSFFVLSCISQIFLTTTVIPIKFLQINVHNFLSDLYSSNPIHLFKTLMTLSFIYFRDGNEWECMEKNCDQSQSILPKDFAINWCYEGWKKEIEMSNWGDWIWCHSSNEGSGS